MFLNALTSSEGSAPAGSDLMGRRSRRSFCGCAKTSLSRGSALLVSVLWGETEAEKWELWLPLCLSRW